MKNLLTILKSFLAIFIYKMKDETGAFEFGQVTAITHNAIKEILTDGVFTSSAYLNRLKQKMRIEGGGNQILCPLMTVDDTGSTGSFYKRADALSLQEYDGISASKHDWKYLQETVVIYKTDIAKNAGAAGVLKLVASKVSQAKGAMGQRMVKGALSDGTSSTGALDSDQFVGLQSIIGATGTSYGGFSDSDLSTWLAAVDDNSGTNRAITKAILDANYDNASENGKGQPSLGLCNKAVFSKIKGLLTAQQRTTREDSMSGFGHAGQVLVYNGIDVLIENQMPDNTFFHVDEEHAYLVAQKDNNMRRQSIQDLETADALLERVFFYGNMVAPERKYHGRINDITE